MRVNVWALTSPHRRPRPTRHGNFFLDDLRAVNDGAEAIEQHPHAALPAELQQVALVLADVPLGRHLDEQVDSAPQLRFVREVVGSLGVVRFPAELAELGVSATIVRRPDIDVRAVRERIGLSQAEFAMRFGFELDTIQNWEQGRNAPDAPAQILLKVIETHPDVVDEVLSAGKPRRKREKSTSRV